LAHEGFAALRVERSLLSSSVTTGEGGGLLTRGGLTLINSTVALNRGGGIAFSVDPGASPGRRTPVTTLVNVTIARNSEGSGLASNLPENRFFASGVILDNTPASSNCSLAAGSHIALRGTNLDSGTSCHLTGFELSSTNPLLADLADNGGPTFTFALLPGSPAIDALYTRRCELQDQRLAPRPAGARCDIGAFEYGAFPPVPRPERLRDIHEVRQGSFGLSLDPALTLRLAADGIKIDVGSAADKQGAAGRIALTGGYMGQRLMNAGLGGSFVFRRGQAAVQAGPGILIAERGRGRLVTKLGGRRVVTLLDLAGVDWTGGKGVASARLTKSAAQRLNALLKTRVFEPGMPFGQIAIDATLDGADQPPKLVDGRP
jgi:hypothetical protein